MIWFAGVLEFSYDSSSNCNLIDDTGISFPCIVGVCRILYSRYISFDFTASGLHLLSFLCFVFQSTRCAHVSVLDATF